MTSRLDDDAYGCYLFLDLRGQELQARHIGSLIAQMKELSFFYRKYVPKFCERAIESSFCRGTKL